VGKRFCRHESFFVEENTGKAGCFLTDGTICPDMDTQNGELEDAGFSVTAVGDLARPSDFKNATSTGFFAGLNL
jgi:hypothetical protein